MYDIMAILLFTQIYSSPCPSPPQLRITSLCRSLLPLTSYPYPPLFLVPTFSLPSPSILLPHFLYLLFFPLFHSL